MPGSSRHPDVLAALIRRGVNAASSIVVASSAENPTPATELATILIALMDVASTGVKLDFQIDFACQIEAWTMLSDVATTARLDLWGDVLANYPPTIADTFPGAIANRPTLTAATHATGDVTGWTKVAIAAGDTIRVNLDANNIATRITLSLKVRRT